MITTKTYLTRGLLNQLFQKKLKNSDLDELVISGKLEKQFSYYKPTELLLRELGIIPDKVNISDPIKLGKQQSFVLREIQEIFSNCSLDTAKILAGRYFYKKYNYWYKKPEFAEDLIEGIITMEVRV
ncbi:MAG: hypothetical protein US52_C0053G0016 [candidate division WS6 bacterium GW2011_GWA2_37_6]|uniref:Uncharacterized protein n=1 Tax=candidate division WS6 bacterium GW2011_GWA2_37_6 TaxID=1619087 RepID=A0A0G0GUB7_9BACT|nr:MAG: hypothetical protein US52_C0053G0016 [candidate division WS6 bacterium GW2011_GWA2_37_6]